MYNNSSSDKEIKFRDKLQIPQEYEKTSAEVRKVHGKRMKDM